MPGHEIAAHPESPFPVAATKPDRIGAGQGLLEVSLRSGAVAEGRPRVMGSGIGLGDVQRYPLPGAHRPWIGDPTVLIGETELNLTWDRWWIPLPLGGHTVEVAIARDGEGPVESDHERYTTWDGAIEVADGWISRLRLNGRAVQYFARGLASLRLQRFDADERSYQSDGTLMAFRRQDRHEGRRRSAEGHRGAQEDQERGQRLRRDDPQGLRPRRPVALRPR